MARPQHIICLSQVVKLHPRLSTLASSPSLSRHLNSLVEGQCARASQTAVGKSLTVNDALDLLDELDKREDLYFEHPDAYSLTDEDSGAEDEETVFYSENFIPQSLEPLVMIPLMRKKTQMRKWMKNKCWTTEEKNT
ncbi:hypothetical protein Pcinc_002833 [Petrolisthes cinctipes]|uniref:Uncharacterized protein n=1 Tax=Petrolisthes cinctipes TaxID=88211 RepID=A0AAE1GK86_PETCI|nr:hypothetical protein Pcinc_002833 [Petrolisthes cinctipes]